MCIAEILDKLEAWSLSTGDFHGDRQLGDEILIACGWLVVADPQFAGGARWAHSSNPRYAVAEACRPQPLLNIGDAVNCIPMECAWRLTTQEGLPRKTLAEVRGASMAVHTGVHEFPSVAIMAAVMSYKLACQPARTAA